MKKKLVGRIALMIALCSPLLLASCKKNMDSVTPMGVATTTETNDWILSTMQYNYLWNDKIPTNPDKSLDPESFYKSLLYDYTNTANINRDRFSYIRSTVGAITSGLSGNSKMTGLEYKFYYADQTRTSIYALVIYVLPGSPAAKAGVKRSDIIAKVNGTAFNTTNYQTLLTGSDSYQLGFATFANNTLTDNGQSKLVTAVDFQMDPVLMDTTYTIGGKTIGYVVYNQFIPGINPDGSINDFTYDLKLDNIFGKFKQKGVNELVLDLRYNPGGYVSSSTNLASLIVKSPDPSKVFFTQQWNSNKSAEYEASRGKGWDTQNFLTKATNIGNSLNRVFVLTTGSTASASELVINGLRPFMTVTTIGSTTYGKNVGSITLSDKTGYVKWAIQPITFKSANAQGFSDYAAGFTPAVEVKEPSTGLKPLGDLTEPFLSEAVFQITGTRMARRAATLTTDELSLGSSLDQKTRELNMVIVPNQ